VTQPPQAPQAEPPQAQPDPPQPPVPPRRAAAEDRLAAQQAARTKRAPVVLLAVLATLVLLVGLTAAVDLRRLATPRGAALGWTAAALSGDCRDYLRLSLPDPARTGCGAVAGRRPTDAQTAGLEALTVVRQGATARVSVVVRVRQVERRAVLTLERQDGRWRVRRDPAACGLVGC
jgi:hypothetical protein